jgi:polyhydroxybutyrate depolymerase
MRQILGSVLLGITVAAVAACSDPSSPSAPATNGATGSTTGSSSAGPTTSGSGGTAGATGAGGTGGSGGASAGSGGSSAMDASAPDGSKPGDANTGRDGGRPPKPSVGCGKTAPTMTSRTIMTGGQTGTYNVHLPTGYDATTPQPLGFGFHGSGNPACGPTGGECQGFAMLPAVTVYMKSLPGSPGWEQANVLEPNITFFNDVLAVMKNEYCIDENRIFIAGVSSGGQFIEHLACRYGDTLWQVTAVSAAVVNAANMNCKGTPPVLVIHGVTDMAGNYGQAVAEMFARRNGCSATPPAALAQTYTDLRAAFNAMPRLEEYKCLDWDACTANPVRICLHSQMTYGGLTHGWPRFGGQLIGEFQAGIP